MSERDIQKLTERAPSPENGQGLVWLGISGNRQKNFNN
jgi:hypothetical protein